MQGASCHAVAALGGPRRTHHGQTSAGLQVDVGTFEGLLVSGALDAGGSSSVGQPFLEG
jgi:hypothetical protein